MSYVPDAPVPTPAPSCPSTGWRFVDGVVECLLPGTGTTDIANTAAIVFLIAGLALTLGGLVILNILAHRSRKDGH